MGGHGGLNILPQKRWNVYNFENREKVRKDEEAAANEEQLKREQSLKRDADFRLQQLRRARGIDPDAGAGKSPYPEKSKSDSPETKSEADSKHVNLFDGIKIFDPVFLDKKTENEVDKRKKAKKEERVVGPEDEKYRLGYGVAGKGVKSPWYMMKPGMEVEEPQGSKERENRGEKRKKTVEELREERVKREKTEKERERALLMQKGRCNRDSGSGYHRDSASGYRDRYYRRDR